MKAPSISNGIKQSKLFTKTRRETLADETAKNANLLIRAGYIHKEMAGVYSYLPLGLRVLNNISNIIREEMNALGAQEVMLTTLQDKAVWEKTNRWSDEVTDNWFKTQLKNGGEVGLGFTHEEALTALLTDYFSSYRDLPVSIYQIQTKFRNELRAKSGLIRGREFLMKDLYSFSRTEAEHQEFYNQVKEAYLNIFKRVGIGESTFVTFASGGTFAKYSHEFQTITEAGEDTIYLSREKKIAVNKEVLNDEVLNDLGLKREELEEKTAVEVGNIFSLGTKFSELLGLNFVAEAGNKQNVIMGSYGIGPGRLMGTIVEVLADDNGLIWPIEVAPFQVHLLALNIDNEEVRREAAELFNNLTSRGIAVLYDDREVRAGEKFADADLLGLPTRVVISEKTLSSGHYEVKERPSGKELNLSETEFFNYLDRLTD